MLLLAGAACTGVGAWQHYHQDAQHIFSVQAGIDPINKLVDRRSDDNVVSVSGP